MESLGVLLKGGVDLDDLLDRYSWDRLRFIAVCVAYSEEAWGESLFGTGKGPDRMERRRKRMANAPRPTLGTDHGHEGTPEGQVLGQIARLLPGSVHVGGDSEEAEARRHDLEATRAAFWRGPG